MKAKAWENVRLSQVVSGIASKIGLKTAMSVSPDLEFERLDQKDMSDLGFIKDLADRYGYTAKVDTDRLIFMRPSVLEAVGAIARIVRGTSDIISHHFNDGSHKIYSACQVRYWNPKTKQLLTHTEQASGGGEASGDVLKISERVENPAQAVERARAGLKRHNKFERGGELMLTGRSRYAAGAKINVSGYGKMDGDYLIEEATHRISKNDGYTTGVKIRRVT